MLRWFAVLCLVIAGGLVRPSVAQAAGELPRLVFVAPTSALLSRVEGQLSDLDVEVSVLSDAQVPSDIELDAPLLAERQGAEWVVWTRSESAAEVGSDSICIWSRASQPLYCRRFAGTGRSGELFDSSAGYELAALTVRSAVRARLLELQAVEAERKPEATEAPPPKPKQPPQDEPAPERAPEVGLELGAGWLWEGLQPSGTGSVHVAGVFSGRRLRLGLGASLAQRNEVNLQQIEVASRRGSVEFGVGWLALAIGDFALQPELAGGLLWHTRTSAAAGGAEATPGATFFAPYFGGRVRFEYALSQRFELCFVPSLDWVPSSNDWIVLDLAERAVAARSSWHLQPGVRVVLRAAVW